MLDDVLLEIEPAELTAAGLEVLERLAGRPEAAWYRRRRLLALAAAGLVGAYNPLQPRGKDGKWILVYGWVRWLSDGNWMHGQVTAWSDKDGSVLVKSSDGKNRSFTHQEISDSVYSLPTPKAKIEFPAKGVDAKGFFKIGGQDGSNPGGLYQVTDPTAVKSDNPVTPEMIKKAMAYNGFSPDTDLLYPGDEAEASAILSTIPDVHALLLDPTTNRTYSKIAETLWDLGTGEQVQPIEVFGAPKSSRRSEILNPYKNIRLVRENMDNFKFSADEILKISNTAKAMAGSGPDKDTKFYVKTSKSPEHARNEMLANYLYELGGVPVPETSLAPDGLTFGSKIVEGDVVVPLSDVMGTPDQEGVLDQLRENFVFDAWLANWDVAGQSFDNVKVVDGVPVRIDAGGSILYRATGPPKGKAFGNDVVELNSLLHNTQNPTAPAVFGGITDAQIMKGVERLSAISPQEIINAIEGHGLDKSLSDKLIARRKFILDKYDHDEPPVDADKLGSVPSVSTVVPESITLPPPGVVPKLHLGPDIPGVDIPAATAPETPTKTHPTDISGMYWNTSVSTFVPGQVPGVEAVQFHQDFLSQQIPFQYSALGIADKFLGGQDVYTVSPENIQTPGLWRVNAVNQPGEGQYQFELIHVATGERWATPTVKSSLLIQAKAFPPDETDAFEDAYSFAYRDYADYTANHYKSAGEVHTAHNLNVPGMQLKTIGPAGFMSTTPNPLKAGDWVFDDIQTADALHPQAYKLLSDPLYIDTQMHVADLEGNELDIEKQWTYRRGQPGSIVNATFDALQARNVVAKAGDTNDPGAPSLVAKENTPTPADVQMQKLSATENWGALDILKDTPVTPAAPPAPPTPTPPSPEPSLSANVDWFDPDTQVNKNINVLGEVIPLQDPDVDLEVLQTLALAGKKFYYRSHTAEGTLVTDGIYDLTKAEPISPSNPQSGTYLTFTDMTGRETVYSTSPKYGYSSFSSSEMYQISGNIAPINSFTLKKDGTIVVNGEVVGLYGKVWHPYSSSSKWDIANQTPGAGYYEYGWNVTVHGKYTASGKDYTARIYSKSDIKGDVVPHILPPGAGGAVPKSVKVKELHKQIVHQQIAFGAISGEQTYEGNAVTLMDGAKVELGMWTISKTDGKIGKIVATKVSPEAGVAGSVKVEYDDPSNPGKKMIKIRGASTLSAAISPEGDVPPGSPLYASVKLGDGSQPFPSQEVTIIHGDFGIIMGIKPDGSVRVLLADGTKKWMSSKKLAASKDYSKTIEVTVDADPAGIVALAAPSHKAPAKPIKIPYSAPGGAVISQPSNAITEYRKYFPERKLTKDNFVPMVGMRVRDTKGVQFVIVRQANSYDSDPSGVWVSALGANKYDKPKKRSPNRLWVDHAAELSTWDGKPLPKVAKLHYTYGDSDSILPDGSTIYSFAQSQGYGAGRTKKIRYIALTPDGKVYNLNAEGSSQMSEWEITNANFWSTLGKIAYFDSGSNATVTVENDGAAAPVVSKVWVHDSTPGSLENLKIAQAQADAAEVAATTVVTPVSTPTSTEVHYPGVGTYGVPTTPAATPVAPSVPPPPAAPAMPAPAPAPGVDVYPEVFNGDQAGLTDLPKPSDAVSITTGATATPPPPQIQSAPERLAAPPTVAGSFSIGTGIDELINKRIPSGEIASRTLYTMGDTDYVEDEAIRLQSVVNSKTGEEMVEVRFRLLEDKVDDLGRRLISNKGKTTVGGWQKTPLKGPKDIVVGDAISVKISTVTPPVTPDHPTAGGALKPDVRDNPNARVISDAVLVGKTPSGADAYRIEVVVAGGATGSIIVEQRATPSVPTYIWDPNKVNQTSYFDAAISPDAVAMGWSVRNADSSGYEVAKSVTQPDEKGRKVLEPDGVSVYSTGSNQGTYRLKYDAGEGSYMTVQATHPDSEKRAPNLWHDTYSTTNKAPPDAVSGSRGIRQSSNGEVLIRVPANDPNALTKISEMMSAAGVPPSAQGQPSGRDLRKMALNKVFKQFNATYTHMERPDVTGDDDASAAAVLALVDKEVKGHMLGDRKVTMDDIMLRVTPHGRTEVIFSDDVARALTEKGKFTHAYHRLHHGYDPKMFTSKAEVGLLSTDERYSAGIIKNGMSSDSDPSYDAGNRVFFRLAKPGQTQQGQIVISAMAINKKLDNYWSPSDYFGRREPQNVASQYLHTGSFAEGSNEIKIKRAIDPEMMAFIVVDNPDDKIAALKKAGITHIWGRPIEEIVISPYSFNDSKVGELGAHYGTEIPITAIPLVSTDDILPPVGGAPVVVASGTSGNVLYTNVSGDTMTGTITFNTTSDPRLS